MTSPSEPGVASGDLLELAGKVCLVTGASRGIGRASARLLALSGANVVLVGRDEQALSQATQEINRDAGAERARPHLCDVTDEAAVRDLYQAVFKSFKRLDVLVANAGVLDDALIGMVSRPQIERVFSVNTFGVLYCAQYASRLMARSGGGSIVNITSIIGTHGNPGQAVYGGSKAAVIGITKSLAKELAPQNVRVNAVAPGFIDTDMTRGLPPEKYEARARSIGMGRVGTAEDIAKVVLFLASDLSAYVTGQIIGVDGAMVI
jgi:3-oxoacyl-[acyl-carrier protein] reductase